MSRALLFVACAASLLAAGFSADVDDKGASSCGLVSTWSVEAGQSRECCTDSSLGSVTGIKYTVSSVTGKGKSGGRICSVARTRDHSFDDLLPSERLSSTSMKPESYVFPRSMYRGMLVLQILEKKKKQQRVFLLFENARPSRKTRSTTTCASR